MEYDALAKVWYSANDFYLDEIKPNENENMAGIILDFFCGGKTNFWKRVKVRAANTFHECFFYFALASIEW